MRVFIIKSVNLLIVAGIIALYCINVRKVGEEKKAIAEKTDKKETIKRISSGNADCLRSGNMRWMRTKDRKYREYSYFPYSTGADRKNGAKIPFLVRTNADRKYGSFICRSVFCHLLWGRKLCPGHYWRR